ncbi:30S ribosomal protein S7 [Neoactinobaculum massilliense]|uniref:30S ribosomal protein S7 n=1 Tax=Neoactinobaculum massilliense TaxID=2364794 RepID=UPI000F54576A|nr:30S ribosomal protein S7 [Neoactinobaculum massilliense]
MSRKGPAKKHGRIPDPVYDSQLVTQLVNRVLIDGKKSKAQAIVYGALAGVKEKTNEEPLDVLKRAMDNIRPSLEVRSRRVGGATYQIPVEVKANRATNLAVRWLVAYARDRRENTMTDRLLNEILDASNGLGGAVKRREDTHRMAEANKAFAHYRW